MPKYEIMLIIDPKNVEVAEKLVHDVFKTQLIKLEKLEHTQLAYAINKVRTANYLLAEVETDGSSIKEFIRRANISNKIIWRHLVVNLDSERAVKSLNAKPRRRFRREYTPRPVTTSTSGAVSAAPARRESGNE